MIKSLLKKEFKIDTTRDVGLDLLRVIALLLMVSIHYARAIYSKGCKYMQPQYFVFILYG